MDSDERISAREARARTKKLQLEAMQIRYALTKGQRRMDNLRTFAALGGVITALAALTAFLFGIYQYRADQVYRNTVREQELMDAALSRLASDNPRERLAASTSLRWFATSESTTHHQQALVALANALATETDPVIRNSILASLVAPSADRTTAESSVQALRQLAALSRALRPAFLEDVMKRESPEQALENSPWDNVAKGIVTLIRNGARLSDLSGIVCVGCDLSGLDLSEVCFDYAVLPGASFSHSDLSRASFNFAYLEAASFYEADLSAARLTCSPVTDKAGMEFLILFSHQIRRKSDWSPPSFQNCNLAGASFTGFPLFGTHARCEQERVCPSWIAAVDFEGATLDYTDFREVQIFAVDTMDLGCPLEYQCKSTFTFDDCRVYRWQLFHSAEAVMPDSFPAFWTMVRGTFMGTDIRRSRMPWGVSDYLATHPPPRNHAELWDLLEPYTLFISELDPDTRNIIEVDPEVRAVEWWEFLNHMYLSTPRPDPTSARSNGPEQCLPPTSFTGSKYPAG